MSVISFIFEFRPLPIRRNWTITNVGKMGKRGVKKEGIFYSKAKLKKSLCFFKYCVI